MRKHRIRTVRTASGATAVQVVWYTGRTAEIEKHVGSAKNAKELHQLRLEAEQYIASRSPQLSLFEKAPPKMAVFDEIEVTSVSHHFARETLLTLADHCGLGGLDILYRDLALMRIIEPCSKRRSIALLQDYFGVSYSRYLYERLPQILDAQVVIEEAAISTAKGLGEDFVLLLYDVTTLYFETHKPDDDLQARGFSKDDKSKQPQIVLGLLVTAQGFPLIHEVFKGNTFEGHTMLSLVKAFEKRHHTNKPIIVADAAMLSKENQTTLEKEGYRYIVGARLANAKAAFIKTVCATLPKRDGAMIRLPYPETNYHVICSYSGARYKKEKRDLEKQIKKAQNLVLQNEPGKRAKFVKKSANADVRYSFDETLKEKTEQLLGIKGYCTNIPEEELSNDRVIGYYHDLWHVEQTFRMSKSDLQARPIFHYAHDAIKAHILICFMSLMIGKFIEIKTGLSLRAVRDMLWKVHDICLRDPTSNRERKTRTHISSELEKALTLLNLKKTH